MLNRLCRGSSNHHHVVHHSCVAIQRMRHASAATVGSRRNDSKTVLQRISRVLSDPRQGVRAAAELYRSEVRPELLAFLEHEDPSQSMLDAVHLGGTNDGEECFILLMKVLCDAKRLEDVRFLFGVAMRQFRTPSIELFNVMLIGVTWSDTFTQEEMDNVSNLMSERQVERDAVTELCFALAFLRLQRPDLLQKNWDATCQKCRDVVHAHLKDSAGHPLPVGFTTKLSQTFAALSRMSSNSENAWGAFLTIVSPLALHAIDHVRKEREVDARSTLALGQSEDALAARVVVTTRILLSALSGCLSNVAVTSQHLHQLFHLLRAEYDLEYTLQRDKINFDSPNDSVTSGVRSVGLSSSAEPSGASHAPAVQGSSLAATTRSSMYSSACALSESNAVRLIARCVRHTNLPFALELISYSTEEHNVLTSPNARPFAHIAVAQIAAASALLPNKDAREDWQEVCLDRMFDQLEKTQSDIPFTTLSKILAGPLTIVSRCDTESGGGDSAKAFVAHVSPRAPGALIRQAILAAGPGGGVDSLPFVWSLLVKRRQNGTLVTNVSVQRVLDAAGSRGDVSFCRKVVDEISNAEGWRESVSNGTLKISEEVYDALIQSVLFQAMRIPAAVDVHEELDKIADSMRREPQPLRFNQSSLHALLRFAVDTGDTVLGVRVVKLYEECSVPLDRTIAAKLLRNLCQILDKSSVLSVLQTWRHLNGGVHPRVSRMCEMAFRKWGYDVDDIVRSHN